MKTITRVGCVGAGLIGQGWATLFSAKGYDVALYDKDAAVLGTALEKIGSNLSFLAVHGFLKEPAAKAAVANIHTCHSLAEAVKDADYVQESVFDDYSVKEAVFGDLGALAPKDAIVASSTSGLLLTRIQKHISQPERCVLSHPFLPVHLMPLVEIAGGDQTSPETLTATRDLMARIGKTPVMLKKEVSGFIANRLQAALLREAIDLVDSGVASAEEVDRAFCLSVGIRGPNLGPLLRAHLAGDGIEGFFEHYSESYRHRWESMASWSTLADGAVSSTIDGIHEMEIVRGSSMEELKSWRDEMLVRVLKVIGETDAAENPR